MYSQFVVVGGVATNSTHVLTIRSSGVATNSTHVLPIRGWPQTVHVSPVPHAVATSCHSSR